MTLSLSWISGSSQKVVGSGYAVNPSSHPFPGDVVRIADPRADDDPRTDDDPGKNR